MVEVDACQSTSNSGASHHLAHGVTVSNLAIVEPNQPAHDADYGHIDHGVASDYNPVIGSDQSTRIPEARYHARHVAAGDRATVRTSQTPRSVGTPYLNIDHAELSNHTRNLSKQTNVAPVGAVNEQVGNSIFAPVQYTSERSSMAADRQPTTASRPLGTHRTGSVAGRVIEVEVLRQLVARATTPRTSHPSDCARERRSIDVRVGSIGHGTIAVQIPPDSVQLLQIGHLDEPVIVHVIIVRPRVPTTQCRRASKQQSAHDGNPLHTDLRLARQ